MRLFLSKLILIFIGSIFSINQINSQVTGVDYVIVYNDTSCIYEASIVLAEGSIPAGFVQRSQANAQYTLVVPTGVILTIEYFYYPTEWITGNASAWNITTIHTAPPISPTEDYYSITPTLSPLATYEGFSIGDTVPLFGFTLSSDINCGANIRHWDNDTDTTISILGSADLDNGFTIGSLNQLYRGNLNKVNPKPVVDIVFENDGQVFFDLISLVDTCNGPYFYEWSGPNGFYHSGVDSIVDVLINPATSINSGTYSVTITDSRDCIDSLDIDITVLEAEFSPEATVGNLVWNDENLDGIQNTFEETVSNVLVQAYHADTDIMVGEVVTDDNGIYSINDISNTNIYLKFYPPAGMVATQAKAGLDDEMDSDVDDSYGENTTRMLTLSPEITNNHIDLGLVFGVLPVTWKSIQVQYNNSSHNISWEVADQTNVTYYIAERMLENEQFFTPVLGTKTNVFDGYFANYQAVDNDVISDITHFYRVKQVDIDGKYSFSDIVSIKAESNNELEIYPNPVSEKLNFEINIPKGDNIEIKIFDATGKMVSLNSFSGDESILRLCSVGVNDLKAGVYAAYVTYSNKTVRKKFVKIK